MEMDQQFLQLSMRTGSVSFKTISALMQSLLRARTAIEHGEQNIRKLNIQGKKLENIPIADADLRNLRRELNRYAVDFSVKKNSKTGEHLIFFKGQDIDRVYIALEKCVQATAVSKDASKQPIKEIVKDATERATERAAMNPLPQRAAGRGQEL